jgi:hypothetical protein
MSLESVTFELKFRVARALKKNEKESLLNSVTTSFRNAGIQSIGIARALEKDVHAGSHAKLQRASLGMPYFFSFALEPFFAAFFFAGIIFTSGIIVGGAIQLL